MKTKALNIVARENNINILALTRLNIPLERLIGRSLGSFEFVSLDPKALGAPLFVKGIRLNMVPLHLKNLDKRQFGLRGIIVGNYAAQILQYLLENWVPSGNAEPDLTLRSLQESRVPLHSQIGALEAKFMSPSDVDDENIEPIWNDSKKSNLLPRFIWTQREFDSTFEGVSIGGRTVYFPVAETFNVENTPTRLAAVIERMQVIRGLKVPRWEILTSANSGYGEPMVYGFQNGHWFHCPFSRLDMRVQEAFENHGRVVSVIEGDLLAAETLDARFILRVPETPISQDLEHIGPVPASIRGVPGALLFDSRCPVNIGNDVDVITDPKEAWSILLRTTSGIFLPDSSPCAPPRSFKQLAGAWIVGCMPAGKFQ